MNGISGYGILGIQRADALATRSAANIARQSVDGANGDVARDFVGLDQARAQNAASAKVIKTADAMQKALLDILA